MNAKKALKKLYKNKSKKSTASKQQLQKLTRPVSQTKPQSLIDNQTKQELTHLSQQVFVSAASELVKPLNPLMSWFNDAPSLTDFTDNNPLNSDDLSAVKKASQPQMANISSIGRLPLKSPPCKRCPALNSGLCKCAVKRFKLSA